MQLLALAIVCLVTLFVLKRLLALIKSNNKKNDLPDITEDIALASKVAAAIGAISIYFLAPAGILAFFVAPPLIVAIAPALGIFAAGAYVVHAIAKLYDKKRKKQGKA